MYRINKAKVGVLTPVFQLAEVTYPKTKLFIGNLAIKNIVEVVVKEKASSILIITDSTIKNLGLLNPLLEELDNFNIHTNVYDQISSDPSFDVIENALDYCQQIEVDLIIGFGGGSVLDAAKVISACIANKFKDPRKFVGILKLIRKPIPLVSVPTTAGTGSEVTIVAVISDTLTHQKKTIIDPRLVSKYTILDPSLTLGLNQELSATVGMDAFTHALESYISKMATKKSRKYASDSIKLISENILVVYNEPTSLHARENMLKGSMYAGEAFSRTFVGYVHAFAHSIGAKFDIPHGLAIAVLLPEIMQANILACEKEFATLAKLVGVATGKNQFENASLFIVYLFNLRTDLNIPNHFEKFPKQAIDEIIDMAFAEAHGTYPLPKYLTRLEARKILSKVCKK